MKPLCSIHPEHVALIATFGTVMATAFVVSILSQKAYSRRVITREEEPCMYWLTVASYGMLAVFTIGGSLVCPLR